MKKYRVLLYLALALLFATTQVLAGPADIPNAGNTHVPKTPGAQATEKANERATRQAGNPHGKHENFKGTVSAVDSDSITLDSSVTIGRTDNTRMKFPGPKDSASGSIQPGMTVMVQAIRDQNGSLIASAIMVIPGQPAKLHRVGTVTEYNANSSIIILAGDGNTYTFVVTGDTKILPAERAGTLGPDSLVTIIAPRDPAGGEVTAKGIVIHPAAP